MAHTSTMKARARQGQKSRPPRSTMITWPILLWMQAGSAEAEALQQRLEAIAFRYDAEVECCADNTGSIYAWGFYSNESTWLVLAEQVEGMNDDQIEDLLLGKRP